MSVFSLLLRAVCLSVVRPSASAVRLSISVYLHVFLSLLPSLWQCSLLSLSLSVPPFLVTEVLKEPLDQYVQDHFPTGLVRILRMPKREGLIRARMKGWGVSQGGVVVFFDSHIEVNVDWSVCALLSFYLSFSL